MCVCVCERISVNLNDVGYHGRQGPVGGQQAHMITVRGGQP